MSTQETTFERHLSVEELSELWNMSEDFVRRLFLDEPGVVVFFKHRPGRRVYFGREEVPRVMGGLGTSILTTSQGVMTGRDAMKAGVVGVVLCNIW